MPFLTGGLGVERDGCRLAVHLIAIVILPETENLQDWAHWDAQLAVSSHALRPDASGIRAPF